MISAIAIVSTLFPETNVISPLSLYDVTVFDEKAGRYVGMGRVVGDGLYYLMVDVVVAQDWQGQGIGSEIVKRLSQYIEEDTPAGGRGSIQGIAEKGKEQFYEQFGFKRLPNEYFGSGMRKGIWKRV